MIAWVDIETTDLEPRHGAILEVGILLTDDELNEIDRTSVVLQPPWCYRLLMKPEVLALHDAGEGNGLLAECEASGLNHYHAASAICLWLGDRVEEPPVMAGNTVGFDRAWLKAKMGVLEALFHYRSIDVSSLKELNERWGFTSKWEGDRKLHRVLPDLEDSIAELRHYRAALGSRRPCWCCQTFEAIEPWGLCDRCDRDLR